MCQKELQSRETWFPPPEASIKLNMKAVTKVIREERFDKSPGPLGFRAEFAKTLLALPPAQRDRSLDALKMVCEDIWMRQGPEDEWQRYNMRSGTLLRAKPINIDAVALTIFEGGVKFTQIYI